MDTRMIDTVLNAGMDLPARRDGDEVLLELEVSRLLCAKGLGKLKFVEILTRPDVETRRFMRYS